LLSFFLIDEIDSVIVTHRNLLIFSVYLDGVVTVVDSKYGLEQVKKANFISLIGKNISVQNIA
jgi:hypothetical protein